MAAENQTPQTAQPPPVQPPATPPPSPPAQPGEKKRISTAAANAPEQPTRPPQPRDPAGQFQSPAAAQPPAPPPVAAPPPPPAAPVPPQQPAAAAPEAPAAPKHPVWLSELAKTSGFTQEQIDRLDTNALGEGVRFAQARGFGQPSQPAPAQPAAAPPPQAQPPAFDLGLTPEQQEEFGPELMGVLTKIGQAAEQKAAILEQRLAQYEQREVQRTQAQVMNTVDMAIAGLPPEYQQLLGGSAPGLEVMQTSPDIWERRVFILESLQKNGLNFYTASPSEIQARIKAKVENHWGLKPAAVNAPVVTRQQWDQAGSPPPTQRTGHESLPAREGERPEDRFNNAFTDEEAEDERIRGSLRRRKQPQPAT